MALFEDVLKGGNIVTGLAIGVGAAILAPMLVPLLRPIAKSVLKAGIMAYDEGRVTLSELNERVEDLLSEVRTEMEQERGNARAHPAAKRDSSTSEHKMEH
jgi:hypothetical protein